MSERRLTLINGTVEVETRRIGSMLEQQDPHHLEFISMRELVRSIGAKAISSTFEHEVVNYLNGDIATPLPNELACDLAHEALTRADMTPHILLNGFPDHVDQVNDFYNLTEVFQRRLTGMLYLTTREPSAQHDVDDIASADLRARLYKNMEIYSIDTAGDESITDHMATAALRELMQQEANLSRT